MATLSLSSLGLTQFRSHERTRLTVHSGPVAIFGANGAGKTNILEAISLFSPGRGLRRAAASEMARHPGEIGWKLTGELSSLGQVHEIETWSEGGAARSVKIDGKTASQVALGSLARVVWLVPAMDRLWTDGADGRRRFLDRLVLSFEPKHGELSLTFEKAMRERNRLLKDQVRDAGWYEALEAQMADAGVQIQQNRRESIAVLMAAQKGAETEFPVADLALESGEHPMPVDVGDYATALAEGRARDMLAGRTLVGPHRADLGAIYAAKGVAARDCSTGEQKALLVSMILANARALADRIGAPPILLLDEVSAHLDASRRAALYDEICALGAQAWLTGTGPELFADLGARAMFLEVMEKNGVSRVEQRDLP